MKTNKLIILLTLVAIIGLICTVGIFSSAAQEKITLKFLHKWPEPENLTYFQDVVKRFEEIHPNIKIEMEAVADEPMKDKLRVMMGGTMPDIFFSWGGEFAKKFVRAGVALDITPYFERYPDWKESFMLATLSNTTFDEKNYGIPIHLYMKFFTYNTEIFDEVGLSIPETWDELLEVSQALKDAGYIPIAMGNEAPWVAIHYMTTLNQKMVPPEVLANDQNPSTNEFIHPGYVNALNYLKTLNDRGYFNESVNTTSNAMANEFFYSGLAGMVYMSQPYYRKFLIENLPGKWGSFPFPSIPEGEGNQNVITGAPEFFLVSANTKYPDEAVEFLRFLTSVENQEIMVKDLGYCSCVTAANNENTTVPEVIEMIDFVSKADGMAEWLDTAVEARIVDKYLANVQLVIGGSKTAEEAMKEIQEVAKMVREEY